MICAEAREYLFAFLDNELDAALSMQVQRHLERCPECAREAEIERTIGKQLTTTLQAGADAPSEKDVVPLGPDIIHSVTNPLSRLTGAIHVYGGDFFATPRKEWDPETLLERPYDVEKNLRLFEQANAIKPAG